MSVHININENTSVLRRIKDIVTEYDMGHSNKNSHFYVYTI